MLPLLIVALACLLLGGLILARARSLQQDTGLPQGRLIYADTTTADWQPTPRPLYSATHRLVGKPDYLVHTKKGIIPVELKTSPAPTIPYLGHLLQLAAYCLLVEETTGHTPPHGLLKYADALYEVDFTPELRRELLSTLAQMRQAHTAPDLSRDHHQPNKCAACSFKHTCRESLAP